MSSINQVVILGNLTRDIELRYGTTGNEVANGSVALNRKWKSKDGEDMEEVSYIDFTVFGKSAETLAKYTSKGSRICLTGRLKQDKWEDKKSGDARSKVVVIVTDFQFLDSGDGNSGKKHRASSEDDAPPRKSKPAPKKKVRDEEPDWRV
jgi:single-strand DNA-binding protein